MRSALRPKISVVALLACSLPGAALAEDREAAAERLFREALASMKQGEFTAACPKLLQSQQLDPAAGTLLYLADCFSKTGRLASAWSTFNEAAEAARRGGQPDREKMATTQAALLEAKVTRLTLEVPATSVVPGLEVWCDDRRLSSNQWNTGIPVDPGEHTIRASAPGRIPWTQTLHVGETKGDRTQVVPLLPVLSHPIVTSGAEESSEDRSRAHLSGSQTAQIAMVALGGVGVVGITVGAILGVRAKSKEKDSEAHCWPNNPSRCNRQGIVLIDEAKTAATWANVGLIGGGVALAGAATLLFVNRSGPSKSATATRLVPILEPQGGRLLLEGGF